jgi:hypothetical protein
MSPALRLMAMQSLGRELNIDGSLTDVADIMCRYFYFLFQSACLLPEVRPDRTGATVLLRKDWLEIDRAGPDVQVPRHGMQLQYDAKADVANLVNTEKVDALPLTNKRSLCKSLHFEKVLQPISEG